MNMKEIDERNKATIEQSKKEGFASFMAQPMVRAMISMLPPSEHLEVILRSAYEAGHSAGAVTTTIELMKIIMRGPPPGRH